jgi:hypothetical protein
MPPPIRHAFRFYTEAGNGPYWYTLSDRSNIERMTINSDADWDESFGDFDAHQRYAYPPRYMVELQMRIMDKEDFALMATLVETIRRGYKFSFAYNSNYWDAVDLATTAIHGTTEIDVTGLLRVESHYRMVGDQGYWNPSGDVSMEHAWPGYQNTHLFKVVAGGAGIYQITPPLQHTFRAGARIARWRFFESCLLLSDKLETSYHDGRWYWMWDAQFTLQRPPELTSPAW